MGCDGMRREDERRGEERRGERHLFIDGILGL